MTNYMTGTAQIESGFRSGCSISGSINSMTNLDSDKMMFGYRLGYTQGVVAKGREVV